MFRILFVAISALVVAGASQTASAAAPRLTVSKPNIESVPKRSRRLYACVARPVPGLKSKRNEVVGIARHSNAQLACQSAIRKCERAASTKRRGYTVRPKCRVEQSSRLH